MDTCGGRPDVCIQAKYGKCCGQLDKTFGSRDRGPVIGNRIGEIAIKIGGGRAGKSSFNGKDSEINQANFSTKNTVQPNVHEKPSHRRRHSFGEDELVYLSDRKRDYTIDDGAGRIGSEFYSVGRTEVTNLDELVRDYRSNRRRGMLSWFKLKKPENLSSSENESSVCDSPASSSKSSHNRVNYSVQMLLGDVFHRLEALSEIKWIYSESK